ncbi:MAG TPA: carnitine 3-dehydrogenase [Gaiellales bacterium]|nr:carnitine 3-dehydrogenase [Gaiellales bacterium]
MADPREALPETVALLGGGVIGGGWAARFLLNGIDVRVHDPDPDAGRKVAEVVENARRATRRLTHAPLPAEGRLELCGSAEDAVAGAALVVESAPEREELKRELFARVERAAPDDALFTSSTSGLRPSALQADMRSPERMLVAHPFNPVYLLPLVELCAGQATAPESVERMRLICEAIGMAPLVVRREIDGFLADRLMEALWRESLWLVNDEVATVSELDDAVRLGAGLRWAAMGTFETYRIAGGEEGMRHFMEQFGPALRWPWTRLTDVPELTDELLDRIAAQSDEQAGGMGFRDMERRRDDCLVGIIQALRARGVGAGAVLERYERSLMQATPGGAVGAVDEQGRPLHRARVLPEWVDYNGHAHESRYLQVFGDATDGVLQRLGVDAEYLEGGHSFYTVETHLSHLREVSAGEELQVTTQVLDEDGKRVHVFHEMRRDGEVVATAEQMLLHVDTGAGRVVEASGAVAERARELATAHAGLPRPERAGRAIGVRPPA